MLGDPDYVRGICMRGHAEAPQASAAHGTSSVCPCMWVHIAYNVSEEMQDAAHDAQLAEACTDSCTLDRCTRLCLVFLQFDWTALAAAADRLADTTSASRAALLAMPLHQLRDIIEGHTDGVVVGALATMVPKQLQVICDQLCSNALASAVRSHDLRAVVAACTAQPAMAITDKRV